MKRMKIMILLIAFLISSNMSAMAFDPFRDTTTIEINCGWGGISSYITPFNPNIEDIFQPIQNNLVILYNMYAIYWPGENINTIGNWENQSAFKIKVTEACEIDIAGIEESMKNLYLNAGWSLMPVICNIPVNVEDLFVSIQESLFLVKDIADTGVYWPSQNINTLGYLLPGKAYFVKMNNSETVIFPPNNFDGIKKTVLSKRNKNQSPWGLIYETQASHIIALPADVTNQFSGSFIGAFTSDNICAGSCFINGNKNKALVINMNDPLTNEKDGFDSDEIIIFKIWKINIGESLLEVQFDLGQPDNTGVAVVDGISAVSQMNIFTGVNEQSLNNIKIFPNPSNGEFNIYSNKEISAVYLYDVCGRLITKPSIHNNLNHNLPKGLYFLHVYMGKEKMKKKIIIN